jgi:hypothetical protein
MNEAKSRGPGSRVSLAAIVPTATRIFIFGPYTALEDARRCMGSSAPDVLRGLESRDDVNVLVFQISDGQLRSVAVSRAAGDFSPDAVGRVYAPHEAEFVVQRSAEWSVLAPVRDVPICAWTTPNEALLPTGP